MKTSLTFIVLLFITSLVIAQEQKEPVIKKILFVKKHIGNYKLTPISEVKNDNKSFSSGEADNFIFLFLPYDEKWPVSTYLSELHAQPFNYLYKDIFVSQNVFSGMYRDYCNMTGLNYNSRVAGEPKIDIRQLDKDNGNYLSIGNIGAAAKMWIVEAEWEEFPINEKPDFIKGLTARTLVFDKYRIFIMKKLLSIKPITVADNEEDRRALEIRNDVVLTSMPN